MDPDSWPILQTVASAALTALFFLAAGTVSEESTQKEITDSGVGVSLRSVAVILLCVPPSAWLFSCLFRLSRSAASALLLLLPGAGETPPALPYVLLTALLLLLVSALLIMLCAVLPMSVGRAHSERYTEELRGLLRFIGFFVPLARLMTSPARRLLRARGVADELGSVTEEDVLDDVEGLDDIDANQKEMIGNIFELADVRAGDIMTHRTELEAVSITASVQEIVDMAIEYGYSRIPVYDGTIDKIVGIACVKDLLAYVGKETAEVDLRSLLRPTLFVPETCRARELLFDFRQKKVQFAVVVDEYGGTAGAVTMEDILECIVGDIEDEYDEEDDREIVPARDGSLVCEGSADIEDVYDALGLGDPPEAIESDTIGGLLTELLGRIPQSGEHPSRVYDNVIELTALSADERRITSVSVRPIRTPSESAVAKPD